MDKNKFIGIIIIVILILSIILVGYSAVNNALHPVNEVPNQFEEILDESDLNQTSIDSSTNSSISTINLNINQKTGGSSIVFADNTSTIYNITSKDDKEIITNVTTNQTGNHLDINIESNASDNTIILSNKYNYNISGQFVAGGFSADLNNNSKVDQMNINATLGGVDIRLHGGTLNNLTTYITSGGLNIIGEPNGLTVVNSEIEVGGVNLNLEKAVADIFSNIEVGGINPGDYQHVSDTEYKGNEFDSSDNKLVLNSKIRVGGVNSQNLPNNS